MYSGYETVFDGADSWNFDNTRNATIVSADNSSSSHTENRKNNFISVTRRADLL